MLSPCFANLSACALPLIPQCSGIHCNSTLLCSNMLYSLRPRLYYPCPGSESNTDREYMRNTTIRTLYGFNNVVVVGLHQVGVLMNEALPFDSMFCHGVHSFPHWMTR